MKLIVQTIIITCLLLSNAYSQTDLFQRENKIARFMQDWASGREAANKFIAEYSKARLDFFATTPGSKAHADAERKLTDLMDRRDSYYIEKYLDGSWQKQISAAQGGLDSEMDKAGIRPPIEDNSELRKFGHNEQEIWINRLRKELGIGERGLSSIPVPKVQAALHAAAKEFENYRRMSWLWEYAFGCNFRGYEKSPGMASECSGMREKIRAERAPVKGAQALPSQEDGSAS